VAFETRDDFDRANSFFYRCGRWGSLILGKSEAEGKSIGIRFICDGRRLAMLQPFSWK
jgi:hypothetical protein